MEGEWEALFKTSPRETTATVFFLDSLLAATHDSVRELHYLLSLLLDAVCQTMTQTIDDAIPAELTARLREIGNRVFRSSLPSVNEEFISRYEDAFFADFVQSTAAFPRAPLASLHDLHARLLTWKRALSAIISAATTFDLPDPMLRPLAGCLRHVTIPEVTSSHSPMRVQPLAVASFTPPLHSPSYQSRHFAVMTDGSVASVASARLRYGLHEMSEEQMVCSLHARVLECCLDFLMAEAPVARQHLHCSSKCLLPVGAMHVLMREKPTDQSLFTLAEALLCEKGLDYDEALLEAVPNYAAWNGNGEPRSAVDFESLARFMWWRGKRITSRMKRMPSITAFERWKNVFVKNLAVFSFLQCFFK